jgi:hypothetical protein
MARSVGRGGPGTIRSAVVDHGNPAVMHGAKATTAVPCKNDGEILDGLMQVVPSHDFTFGRFMGLADAMECKRLFSVEYLDVVLCRLIAFRDDAKGHSTSSPVFSQVSDGSRPSS